MKLTSYLVAIFLLLRLPLVAQTSIQTSFESPSYTIGNLNSQNSWSLTSGNATVSNAKAKTGTNAINFNNTSSALLLNYLGYSGSVPGIGGIFYTDMWVNPVSFGTKGIFITAYDQYGLSSKRIYVIEFTPDNKIRIADGTTNGIAIGAWTSNTWARISIQTNLTGTGTFRIAINGTLNATEFNLRESYTPVANGTRTAIKEFHSLRINHTADGQISDSNFAIDDIYIGKNPIPDISFLPSATARIINVTQPSFGNIALSPIQSSYEMNTAVTATLTVPQGYINDGWTGDLSGTELVKSFNITNNMVIGANVIIDNSAPPASYTVTVTQPANGTITLSPAPVGGKYSDQTTVTATISTPSCYQFNGWTGGLSGSEVSKSFTVTGDLSIGTDVGINVTPGITRTVATVTAFKAALAAMNPGDLILVEDGTYDLSSLTINRSACPTRPIVIKARNQGQVILNGATALVLDGLQYVTVQGFTFRSTNVGTGIKMLNCNRVRITKNDFALDETGIASCNWVYIGDTFGSTAPLRSGNNRIDYNVFSGKTKSGKYVLLDGNINQQSQHDTISYNIFKNNGPREENEKETIRIGVSTLSQSNGYTVVEYNLFEDCDGDPEIVSVKSFANTVRYNTFRRCLGTVCLRQGNNSIVEGNYFFGEGKTAIFVNENGVPGVIGCGGVRVYGKNHKIFNNYFSGLTGSTFDAALTITNGDALNVDNPTDLAKHYVPENVVFAFNTLVNNKSNIEIGYKYDKAPINCLITNNIVVDASAQIVTAYSPTSLAGVSFSNNIMYATQTSSIGIAVADSQIKNINPLFETPVCNGAGCELKKAHEVLRLSAASPAINAATGTYAYVLTDNEMQARLGVADMGADEYDRASPVLISALDEENVGPNAISFSYSYLATLPVKLLAFTATYAQQIVNLNWSVTAQVNVKQYEVEWRTDGADFRKVATIAATPENGVLTYMAKHSNPAAGNNYYRLKSVDYDGNFDYSTERVVKVFTEPIKVYPNPATTNFTINLGYIPVKGTQLRIINSLGNKVMETSIGGETSYTFPLVTFPSGMYYIQLIEPGKNLASFPLVIVK